MFGVPDGWGRVLLLRPSSQHQHPIASIFFGFLDWPHSVLPGCHSFPPNSNNKKNLPVITQGKEPNPSTDLPMLSLFFYPLLLPSLHLSSANNCCRIIHHYYHCLLSSSLPTKNRLFYCATRPAPLPPTGLSGHRSSVGEERWWETGAARGTS